MQAKRLIPLAVVAAALAAPGASFAQAPEPPGNPPLSAEAVPYIEEPGGGGGDDVSVPSPGVGGGNDVIVVSGGDDSTPSGGSSGGLYAQAVPVYGVTQAGGTDDNLDFGPGPSPGGNDVITINGTSPSIGFGAPKPSNAFSFLAGPSDSATGTTGAPGGGDIVP